MLTIPVELDISEQRIPGYVPAALQPAYDPALPDVPGRSEPPVLVAGLDPVPNGKTEIVIPGTGADIREIASAHKFEIRGEVTGRPP